MENILSKLPQAPQESTSSSEVSTPTSSPSKTSAEIEVSVEARLSRRNLSQSITQQHDSIRREETILQISTVKKSPNSSYNKENLDRSCDSPSSDDELGRRVKALLDKTNTPPRYVRTIVGKDDPAILPTKSSDVSMCDVPPPYVRRIVGKDVPAILPTGSLDVPICSSSTLKTDKDPKYHFDAEPTTTDSTSSFEEPPSSELPSLLNIDSKAYSDSENIEKSRIKEHGGTYSTDSTEKYKKDVKVQMSIKDHDFNLNAFSSLSDDDQADRETPPLSASSIVPAILPTKSSDVSMCDVPPPYVRRIVGKDVPAILPTGSLDVPICSSSTLKTDKDPKYHFDAEPTTTDSTSSFEEPPSSELPSLLNIDSKAYSDSENIEKSRIKEHGGTYSTDSTEKDKKYVKVQMSIKDHDFNLNAFSSLSDDDQADRETPPLSASSIVPAILPTKGSDVSMCDVPPPYVRRIVGKDVPAILPTGSLDVPICSSSTLKTDNDFKYHFDAEPTATDSTSSFEVPPSSELPSLLNIDSKAYSDSENIKKSRIKEHGGTYSTDSTEKDKKDVKVQMSIKDHDFNLNSFSSLSDDDQADRETPPLSASSIASSKRLEWDNGADIGYGAAQKIVTFSPLRVTKDAPNSKSEALSSISEKIKPRRHCVATTATSPERSISQMSGRIPSVVQNTLLSRQRQRILVGEFEPTKSPRFPFFKEKEVKVSTETNIGLDSNLSQRSSATSPERSISQQMSGRIPSIDQNTLLSRQSTFVGELEPTKSPCFAVSQKKEPMINTETNIDLSSNLSQKSNANESDVDSCIAVESVISGPTKEDVPLQQYVHLYDSCRRSASHHTQNIDTDLNTTNPSRQHAENYEIPLSGYSLEYQHQDLHSRPWFIIDRNISEVPEYVGNVYCSKNITEFSGSETNPHIRWYPFAQTRDAQDIKDVSTQTGESFMPEQLEKLSPDSSEEILHSYSSSSDFFEVFDEESKSVAFQEHSTTQTVSEKYKLITKKEDVSENKASHFFVFKHESEYSSDLGDNVSKPSSNAPIVKSFHKEKVDELSEGCILTKYEIIIQENRKPMLECMKKQNKLDDFEDNKYDLYKLKYDRPLPAKSNLATRGMFEETYNEKRKINAKRHVLDYDRFYEHGMFSDSKKDEEEEESTESLTSAVYPSFSTKTKSTAEDASNKRIETEFNIELETSSMEPRRSLYHNISTSVKAKVRDTTASSNTSVISHAGSGNLQSHSLFESQSIRRPGFLPRCELQQMKLKAGVIKSSSPSKTSQSILKPKLKLQQKKSYIPKRVRFSEEIQKPKVEKDELKPIKKSFISEQKEKTQRELEKKVRNKENRERGKIFSKKLAKGATRGKVSYDLHERVVP